MADPVMGPGARVAHSMLTFNLIGPGSGTVRVGRRPAFRLRHDRLDLVGLTDDLGLLAATTLEYVP